MAFRSFFNRRSRRGFTLPEVMVATSVMVMGVTVFGTSFPSCTQILARGRHTDMASDACQKRLDFYRQVGYSSLPAVPSSATSSQVSFTPPGSLPRATGVVTFTRVTKTFAETNVTTARMRVDVTVTWNGSGADRGFVTLTSLVVQTPD